MRVIERRCGMLPFWYFWTFQRVYFLSVCHYKITVLIKKFENEKPDFNIKQVCCLQRQEISPLWMAVGWETQKLANEPMLMWYNSESPLGLFLSILSKPMSILSTKKRIRLHIEIISLECFFYSSRIGGKVGKEKTTVEKLTLALLWDKNWC